MAFRIDGPGNFSFDIVGESHYQQALEALAGGRTERGVEILTDAVLLCENDNAYDSLAVRVDIGSRTVGYLSRENARKYRRWLVRIDRPEETAECEAVIVGGWDRGGGDFGHFGVRLDLPAFRVSRKKPASGDVVDATEDVYVDDASAAKPRAGAKRQASGEGCFGSCLVICVVVFAILILGCCGLGLLSKPDKNGPQKPTTVQPEPVKPAPKFENAGWPNE